MKFKLFIIQLCNFYPRTGGLQESQQNEVMGPSL